MTSTIHTLMTDSTSIQNELEATKAQLAELQDMMIQQQRAMILSNGPQTESISVVTPDPVVSAMGAVRTQATATGFEQFMAFLIGGVTGGPFGAILSPLALRGFQGKWGAWQGLGLVAAPASWLAFFLVVGGANAETIKSYETNLTTGEAIEQVILNIEKDIAAN